MRIADQGMKNFRSIHPPGSRVNLLVLALLLAIVPLAEVSARQMERAAPDSTYALSALGSKAQIILRWMGGPTRDEVVYYVLHRTAGTDSTARAIRTTRTSYVDREVVIGTSYCYTVSAVDTSGKERAPSPPACASPSETVTFTEMSFETGLTRVSEVRSVMFVDCDADGWPEVYAATNDRGMLFRNEEGGAFAEGVSFEIETYGRPAFGDWNNDGLPDLFTGDTVYRAFEKGMMPVFDVWTELGFRTRNAAFGDYDRDGRLDIYMVGDGPNGLCRVREEDGFESVGPEAGVDDPGDGYAARFFDCEGDGDMDLYVVNANGPNVLYRNEGDGTFSDITAEAGVADYGDGRDVAFFDCDGDGDMDLYVVNANGSNALYRNEGDGTFSDITAEAGLADVPGGTRVRFVDCDNDGDEDLYLAAASGASALYLNDEGFFRDVTLLSGLPTAGVADADFADYDGDGDQDAAIASDGGGIHLYRNNGSPAHLLTVRLVGIRSVRNGTGARVRAVYGDRSQTRQAVGREVSFGLGAFSFVDSVVVLWPSGISQILTDVDADRSLTLVEHVSKDSTRSVARDGLRVLAPNGDEIWRAGEEREIRWTLHRREGTASILYYSLDDGAEWLAIDAVSGEDTVYVWRIPEVRSDRARVKVTLVGSDGEFLGEDTSDGMLSLRPPEERVPEIRVIEFEHDFGAIPSRETAEWIVVLSNTGGEDLMVLDASSTHDAFALVSPMLPAIVGSEQALAITIRFSPPAPGMISGSLVLGTSDPGTPEVVLSLTGGGLDDVPPEMPIALKAVSVDAGIEVSWSRSPAGDLARYVIYRGDQVDFVPGSPADALGTTADTMYIDTGVPEGEMRFYRVSAIDVVGNESNHSEVAAGTWNELDPPYVAEMSPNPGASDVPETWRLRLVIRDDGAGVDPASIRVEVNGLILPDSCLASGDVPDEYVVFCGSFDEPPTLGDTVWVQVAAQDLAKTPNGMSERMFFVLREETPELRIGVSEPVSPGVEMDLYLTAEMEEGDPEGALSAWLFYRRAGEAVYDSSEMIPDGDIYEGVVPSKFVTSRGLEYYIVASDGPHRSLYPSAGPEGPRALRIHVPNEETVGELVSGVGSEETGYRMFSVPFELDDPDPVSVLEDDLDPAGMGFWKASRYNPGENVYEDHPSFGEIEPGKAYWLLSKDETDPLDVGSGYSIATDRAYRIVLHPGWNQIGLPFNFWINWDDIVRESGDPPVEAPWRYEGGLLHDVRILNPWEGYWVKNMVDEPILLKIPPRQTQRVELESAERRWNEGEWGVRISAHCGDARDEDNLIGVLRDASEEWDPNDVSEPPPVGHFVSLYLPHEDWLLHSGEYAMDLRPADEMIHTWRLAIRSSAEAEEIVLGFDILGEVPEEIELRLVDMTSGEAVELMDQRIYRFELEPGEIRRELMILSGPPGYVETAEQESRESPRRYFLSQNFPNPFNGTTTITYAVPIREDGAEAFIHLGVYNMLGQEIRCLVDEVVSPGFYSVDWDGTDLHGKFAGAGIYFYKLVAEDFELMKRMIYLK